MEATKYEAPAWSNVLTTPAAGRFPLGNFPTPLHVLRPTALLPADASVWLKRDDQCGIERSGNKTRKLEFLVADALAKGADTLVTAGAMQSNHARATAAAARTAGLRCDLLLRCADPAAAARQAVLPGNLLLDRLLGARVHFVSEDEYTEHGSDALLEQLRRRLLARGDAAAPYVIPVGGSNALGAWGYIECVREVQGQLVAAREAGSTKGGGSDSGDGSGFTDIAFACGSGGTAAGLALGVALSAMQAAGGDVGSGGGCSGGGHDGVLVHAFMVCDNEDEFRLHIGEEIIAKLVAGEDGESGGAAVSDVRALVDATLVYHEATGAGYGVSTAKELEFLAALARDTGVLLDPTYSGKAFFALAQALADPAQATRFRGRRVLFVHTGGIFSWFAKEAQLAALLDAGECERFAVDVEPQTQTQASRL